MSTPYQPGAAVTALPSASGYVPPLSDIADALEIAGLPALLATEAFAHVDAADVEMALREFGRLAAEIIAPTDRLGDLAGTVFVADRNEVTTPAPFHDAYRHYVEGGWGSLQFPAAYGGGGFPTVVALALQEMFASANLALSLNPVLTQGAIDLLLGWGSSEQRERYLPRMLTGEWSGTMALTEAEAGSDLGRLSTRAERDADGNWRITGTKIFLSWGEHDLTGNIIHLVLARVPGSPPGSQGISTFIVPKILLGPEGGLGARNTLGCIRVEEKLGIHASPTCVMEFDGAIGELVGEEHDGLHAMFTMMNAARLSIGLEGPAVGERAFQQASAYAEERVQGHVSATSGTPPGAAHLIEHPDVRRMLLDMRTRVLAGRLLIYCAAAHGDSARHLPDAGQRAEAQAMVDLLTPIAKAWSTDAGVATASLGIQVLGGVGFLEESGMAQRLRDARITTIYEGTNGIQAIDLLVRKVGHDGGRCMGRLSRDIEETLTAAAADRRLAVTIAVLAEALAVLRSATTWMLAHLDSALNDALAGATSYLELAGITIGGWLMLRRAMRSVETGTGERAVIEAEFFATETVARAAGLLRPITSGAGRLGLVGPSV
jgi:alkylation response protein AidB-like acyl-CoA dehydrogenase